MPVTKSVVHDYSAGIKNSVHSQVYTLDMPKFVYVQVAGRQEPAKIRADKVEKVSDGHDVMLVLKNDGQEVGEFYKLSVQGWWIEEELDEKK